MTTIRVRLVPIGQGRTAVIDAAGRVLVSGTDGVVCRAARVLIEQGADRHDRIEAFRGDVLCLSGPLRVFASLTVSEDAKGMRFTKWRAYDGRAHDGVVDT